MGGMGGPRQFGGGGGPGGPGGPASWAGTSGQYKTVLCSKWGQVGLSDNQESGFPKPALFMAYLQGLCTYGTKCMFAHGTNELRSSNGGGGGGGQPKVFVLFFVLSDFVLFLISKKTKIEMREGGYELGFKRMKRENKKREERREGEETKDKGSNGTQSQSHTFCTMTTIYDTR